MLFLLMLRNTDVKAIVPHPKMPEYVHECKIDSTYYISTTYGTFVFF